MSEEFKVYYDYLKEELEHYRGDYDEYLFFLPELFKLLCEILTAKLAKADRLRVSAALGYFVAPTDVIHDEVYGPAGYVDDMFLCCYVLNKLEKKYSIKFLNKYWHFPENLESVLEICYFESAKVIEEENLKNKILEFVGLK